MQPTRRHILTATGALCASAMPLGAARPQGAAWPSKPIRIIVPGGPGGVTDIRARWLADRLAPALGQPIVVENRAGAGGNLGTVVGARSAPDGYTLVIIHIGTMAINPHIYANPGYDPLTDLVPITRLGVGPQALVVHKSVPAHSVAELVSLAKAKPGELTFNSPGVGTPGHLASSLLMHLTGIQATHVPYKGGGQAAADLVAGHVTWSIEGLTVLKPFIQDGRLRPLAVTTARRAKSMPDLPTMAEAGVPGFESATNYTLFAPKAVSPDIQKKLNALGNEVVGDADFRERMLKLGIVTVGGPQEEVQAKMPTEMKRWADVIQKGNIKPS